jgi:hypothetical protein
MVPPRNDDAKDFLQKERGLSLKVSVLLAFGNVFVVLKLLKTNSVFGAGEIFCAVTRFACFALSIQAVPNKRAPSLGK